MKFRISKGGVVLLAGCIMSGIAPFKHDLCDGIALGIMTIVCLLLHECGHVFAADLLSVPVHEIGVCLIGFYNRRSVAPNQQQEFWIALSGPFINLIIAILSFHDGRLGQWIAFYNLILFITNMLPLRGSDGRRAITALRTIVRHP